MFHLPRANSDLNRQSNAGLLFFYSDSTIAFGGFEANIHNIGSKRNPFKCSYCADQSSIIGVDEAAVVTIQSPGFSEFYCFDTKASGLCKFTGYKEFRRIRPQVDVVYIACFNASGHLAQNSVLEVLATNEIYRYLPEASTSKICIRARFTRPLISGHE